MYSIISSLFIFAFLGISICLGMFLKYGSTAWIRVLSRPRIQEELLENTYDMDLETTIEASFLYLHSKAVS